MLIDYCRGHISFHYLPIQNPSHVKNQQGLHILQCLKQLFWKMLSSATWQNLNFRSHEIIRVPVSIYIYGCNLCMWEDFFKDKSWINCMTVKRVSIIDNLMWFFLSIGRSGLGYIVAVLGKEYCIIIKCEGKKNQAIKFTSVQYLWYVFFNSLVDWSI
jgi:hypothetical protein